MIWAPWSAHSQEAFTNLDRARDYFAGADVVDRRRRRPGECGERDHAAMVGVSDDACRAFRCRPKGLALTEARNQMPTTLLFRDGLLVDKKLGAQSFEQLRAWIESVDAASSDGPATMSGTTPR